MQRVMQYATQIGILVVLVLLGVLACESYAHRRASDAERRANAIHAAALESLRQARNLERQEAEQRRAAELASTALARAGTVSAKARSRVPAAPLPPDATLAQVRAENSALRELVTALDGEVKACRNEALSERSLRLTVESSRDLYKRAAEDLQQELVERKLEYEAKLASERYAKIKIGIVAFGGGFALGKVL